MPAIETYEGLDEFRRFQHVVRSNYAHQLAPDKVQALAGKLRVVSQNLLQDCQQFLTQVKPISDRRSLCSRKSIRYKLVVLLLA